MSDSDEKDELPFHLVLGTSEYAAPKNQDTCDGWDSRAICRRENTPWSILKQGQEVAL